MSTLSVILLDMHVPFLRDSDNLERPNCLGLEPGPIWFDFKFQLQCPLLVAISGKSGNILNIFLLRLAHFLTKIYSFVVIYCPLFLKLFHLDESSKHIFSSA